ncbi:hypothetical protein BD289DRAFT_478379 [Coniella lustricola]|uniref:Uncharacterized protein n=1 Tax=Coniella lustricola TaxID=2025994 RepID=A0A2T3AM91_9PEZI|nr:hypothetical protein BD289DRAFT_478379 [Coniella lustricola]
METDAAYAVIAVTGYDGNTRAAIYFGGTSTLLNTIGALSVGIMTNFGIVVGGSLIAGVTNADWIVSDDEGETGIEDLWAASGIPLDVTVAVTQITISISMGLSLGTFLVYPMEWNRKRKT